MVPGGQRPKLAEEVARLKVVLVAMVGVEVGVVVAARDGWGQRRGIAASAQLSGRPGRPTPKTRGGGVEKGVAMVGVGIGIGIGIGEGVGVGLGIGVGAQIGIGVQSAKNVVSGILLAKVRALVVNMNEEVGALVLTLPNSVPGIRF